MHPEIGRHLYEVGMSLVHQAQSLMESMAVVGLGLLCVFALVGIGYLAVDAVLAETHIVKGEVLAKETAPAFALRPVTFGFVGGFGSVRVPDRHFVSVRTPHGVMTFRATQDLHESLAVGDDAIVRYRQARFSGRLRPDRVLV